MSELRALLDTVERVAANLSPERRHDLVDLGASLAQELGGDDVQRALRELEARIGVTAGMPAPRAAVTRECAIAHAAPFDVAALQNVLDGEHAETRNEVRRLLDDPALRAYGLPLLSYPTHGRRLLPRLARSYVLSFAVDGLRRRFAEATRVRKEAPAGPPADSRELEAQAAAIKALATLHAVETARACREACGGQGYLSVNRLPDLCADLEVFTTLEGDNTVLLQLVAKSLLAGFKRRFDGQGLGGRATSPPAHVRR